MQESCEDFVFASMISQEVPQILTTVKCLPPLQIQASFPKFRLSIFESFRTIWAAFEIDLIRITQVKYFENLIVTLCFVTLST